MRQANRRALVVVVAVTAIGAYAMTSTTATGGDHGDAVRVSKRLAVEVSVPVCVLSGAQEVVVPVVFRNTSGREATVVWETPRSIQVWKQYISVLTGGWASHEKQWIALQAGETAKREVVLKFGEDVPGLDEGNYTLSLDFSVRDGSEAASKHERLDVVVHAMEAPVGHSLDHVVNAAGIFYSKQMRKNRASTEHWQLTPHMYPGQWTITFGAVSGPHAVVCVNKATGKASEPAGIP